MRDCFIVEDGTGSLFVRLGFPSILFSSGFRPNFYVNLLCLPCVLNILWRYYSKNVYGGKYSLWIK